MNNLQKMKNAFKSDIDNMTIEQFHNFYCHFCDPEATMRQYGINIEDEAYYTCDRCMEEHNGCLAKDTDNANNECFKAFEAFCKKEANTIKI